MAVYKPNQDSFESIEGISQKAGTAAKKAVKAVGDTVKAMAVDAKQQVTGDYSDVDKNKSDSVGMSGETQQEVEDKKKKMLAETRQNLQVINMDIKKIRQQKVQETQQVKQAEKQNKQKEKFEDNKKNEQPLWQKMLKKGSHEMQKGVSG